MFAKILITTGLVSAGLLLFIVITTTPVGAGAFGILAVFLLSYIVTLTIFTFLLYVLSAFIGKVSRRRHISNRVLTLTLKKSYYFSTILALGPVIVMGLQSVGGASVYELGLVVLFIVLGCLYVGRRSS